MNTTETRGQREMLSKLLQDKGDQFSTKKITAGFDGFVDTIVKVIRNKQTGQSPDLFKTIKEFGGYIMDKEGSSFSLELQERENKLGGNMPILANALGRLGVPVSCIGALGYPQRHAVFNSLSSNCTVHSFANPGTSTAVEFQDGKIILGQMDTLHQAGWDTIKNLLGIETLVSLFSESDLLCLVNWAEIDASSDIWKGILNDVLPACEPTKKQTLFIDLSDLSKRTRDAILDVLDLLRRFTTYTNVILGLNQNEARLIYETLIEKPRQDDLEFLGSGIFEQLELATLVLHSPRKAIAVDHSGIFSCESFFVENPKISTGAGDNFNAGFCVGQLLELDPAHSLVLANAVSSLYVTNGVSPQLSDVIFFLENDPTTS